MAEQGEEVLRVVIEDDASSPATSASDALERLQRAFDSLSAGGAEKYFGSIKDGAEGAAKEFKRLGDIGKTAGSALAAAMSGTQNRMLAAVAGTTKLSSALELATKRAKELKAAEDRAFAEAMVRSNRTPTALQSSPGEAGGFRKVVNLVGSVFGSGAAGKLTGAAAVLGDITKELEPILPMLGAVASAGAAAAVVAVAAGAKFVSATILAQAYREDVQGALELITKSEAGANAVLGRISSVSDDLGMKREDTAGKFISLMNKGLDEGTAEQVIKRLADLGEVNPAAPLEALSDAIGTISAKGAFASKSLNALAEAGIKTDDVYAALEKQLGKTRPELEQLMSKGDITGKQGIDAVLETIKAKTGGGEAGALAAAESMDDMAALIKRLEDIPQNLLFDIDAGPGMDATKAKMREVIEFFSASTDSGKEVRQVLGDTFNAIAEGLFGIDTSKGGGVKETLQSILDVVKNSKGDIKAFASGIAAIGGGIAWIAGVAGTVSNAKKSLNDFFGFTPPAGIWGMILLGPLYLAAQAIKALSPEFYAAGANLINGLIDGIKGAAAGVWNAAKGAASGAVDAVKGIWQTRSPSKVAEKLGGYFDMGLAAPLAANDNASSRAAAKAAVGVVNTATQTIEIGLRGGRDRVAGASERLSAIALGASTPANDTGEALAAPRPASGGQPISVSVVVQVAASPAGSGAQGQPEEIGRVVRREVVAAVRSLLREAS